MSDFILRPGLWLLICDAKRALLLKNDGGHGYPKLETQQVFHQDNPFP